MMLLKPAATRCVGGTCEIVNEETGFLIEKDFDTKELADKILTLKKNKNFIHLRNTTREYWKEHFFSDTNYSLFFNQFN